MLSYIILKQRLFLSITNKRLEYIQKHKKHELLGLLIKKHTGSSSK